MVGLVSYQPVPPGISQDEQGEAIMGRPQYVFTIEGEHEEELRKINATGINSVLLAFIEQARADCQVLDMTEDESDEDDMVTVVPHGDLWRARCTCGWEITRTSAAKAQQSAQQHAEETGCDASGA